MRRDAQRNEVAILHHAGRLLANDPNVAMSEIARSAGVSRATLYTRYPDRESLTQATLDAAFAELRAAFAKLHQDTRPPIVALRTLIVDLATNAQNYPMVVVAIRQDIADKEVQQTIAALRDLVARGQDAGEVRGDVSTDLLLEVIMGSLAQAGFRGRHSSTAAPGEFGEELAAVLLGGIAVPSRRRPPKRSAVIG